MTIMSSFGSAVTALLLLLVVVGADNPTITGSQCSDQKIPRGSPYFDTLGNLLQALGQHTYDKMSSGGYDYMTSYAGVGDSPTAYGCAHCNNILSNDYCQVCVVNLCNSSWSVCGNAVGGQLQFGTALLQYCSIQYQQQPL